MFFRSIQWVYGLAGIRGVVATALARELRLQILIKARARELTWPVYLRPRTTDLFVYRDILREQQYDCDLPFEPKVIVDAGANIGLTSVFFANKYREARIIALEPEEGNFRMLLKNAESYPHIEAVRSALWKNDGYIDIVNPRGRADEFQVKDSPNAYVPALSVVGLLNRFRLTQIDILKMDIEGAEYEIFQGDLSWLPQVRLLIVELHDWINPLCSQSVHAAMSRCKTWQNDGLFYFLA